MVLVRKNKFVDPDKSGFWRWEYGMLIRKCVLFDVNAQYLDKVKNGYCQRSSASTLTLGSFLGLKLTSSPPHLIWNVFRVIDVCKDQNKTFSGTFFKFYKLSIEAPHMLQKKAL